MVRYLPAPRLRQAGLTTNGKSNTDGLHNSFALRYRRVNEPFYEAVNFCISKKISPLARD